MVQASGKPKRPYPLYRHGNFDAEPFPIGRKHLARGHKACLTVNAHRQLLRNHGAMVEKVTRDGLRTNDSQVLQATELDLYSLRVRHKKSSDDTRFNRIFVSRREMLAMKDHFGLSKLSPREIADQAVFEAATDTSRLQLRWSELFYCTWFTAYRNWLNNKGALPRQTSLPWKSEGRYIFFPGLAQCIFLHRPLDSTTRLRLEEKQTSSGLKKIFALSNNGAIDRFALEEKLLVRRLQENELDTESFNLHTFKKMFQESPSTTRCEGFLTTRLHSSSRAQNVLSLGNIAGVTLIIYDRKGAQLKGNTKYWIEAERYDDAVGIEVFDQKDGKSIGWVDLEFIPGLNEPNKSSYTLNVPE